MPVDNNDTAVLAYLRSIERQIGDMRQQFDRRFETMDARYSALSDKVSRTEGEDAASSRDRASSQAVWAIYVAVVTLAAEVIRLLSPLVVHLFGGW